MKTRRNYKPRKRYGRGGWYNSKVFNRVAKSGMSIAKMAAAAYFTSKALKKADNIEYKLLDTAFSVNNVDWTGNIRYPLSSITQGDTDSNRIGDSVKLQNYTLRYRCVWNPAETYTQIRVLIVEDKQCRFSQGALTMSSLLNNNATAYAPLAPKVYDNRFMTKILYDQTHTLYADRPCIEKQIVLPLNFHTQFDGSTGRRTGDLMVCCISNIAPGVNAPFVDFVERITYTDN